MKSIVFSTLLLLMSTGLWAQGNAAVDAAALEGFWILSENFVADNVYASELLHHFHFKGEKGSFRLLETAPGEGDWKLDGDRLEMSFPPRVVRRDHTPPPTPVYQFKLTMEEDQLSLTSLDEELEDLGTVKLVKLPAFVIAEKVTDLVLIHDVDGAKDAIRVNENFYYEFKGNQIISQRLIADEKWAQLDAAIKEQSFRSYIEAQNEKGAEVDASQSSSGEYYHLMSNRFSLAFDAKEVPTALEGIIEIMTAKEQK